MTTRCYSVVNSTQNYSARPDLLNVIKLHKQIPCTEDRNVDQSCYMTHLKQSNGYAQ